MMEENALSVAWRSPGPIATAFMNSRKRIQAIMGPIGSGKTRTCFTKAIMLAAAQAPSPIDGKRYFKLCVIRDTYRRLWETTIPSWEKLIPKDACHWSGGFGDPAHAHIVMKLGDGSEINLFLDFIAIGDQSVEDAMRGYEPSAFYLNEADLLEEDVFTYARSRFGRFPDMIHGGPTWYGIMMDFNAPDTENWTYERIVTGDPDNVAFFRQPSALSALAENVQNLVEGYYAELAQGQPDWWLRRFIKNEFGFSRMGKPIYPEWLDSLHVSAQPLRPVRHLPLIIGFDAGLSPAAAITQHMPNGQWRVYEEVVTEQGTGPTRFGDHMAQVLRDGYAGWLKISGWADPSAQYGADKELGERTWIEIVGDKAGIVILPAPTNELIPRFEAVRQPLTRLIDGEPGFLMSPTCGKLRAGFASQYRFRKLQVHGTRYDDKPEKNAASHIHDALQYALSGGGEDAELGLRQRYFMQAEHLPRQAEPYNPFGDD